MKFKLKYTKKYVHVSQKYLSYFNNEVILQNATRNTKKKSLNLCLNVNFKTVLHNQTRSFYSIRYVKDSTLAHTLGDELSLLRIRCETHLGAVQV